MLETVKDTIHKKINDLFAEAALDNLAGDSEAYKEKLQIIALVAETLGVDTEITSVSINMKTGRTIAK